MAPRAQVAFTPSADILWDGELPPAFRTTVTGILGQELSDDQWGGLCSVVRGDSMWLNHEYAAASLSDQKKAAGNLVKASEDLVIAIEAANTLAMGSLVRHRVAEKWDQIYDRSAEFERHRDAMADDIAYVLEQAGHGAAREQAAQLLSDWLSRGILVHPSQPSDFLVDLEQFRAAAGLLSAGFKRGTEYSNEAGDAWVNFIGRLTEWLAECGFRTGASKSAIISHGKITYLAEAVNSLIPDMLDESGARVAKQMRRPPIEQDSLAGAIIKAQKEYAARAPRPD